MSWNVVLIGCKTVSGKTFPDTHLFCPIRARFSYVYSPYRQNQTKETHQMEMEKDDKEKNQQPETAPAPAPLTPPDKDTKEEMIAFVEHRENLAKQKLKKKHQPTPAQLANLRPFNTIPPEEAAAIRAKGAAAQRKNKERELRLKKATEWVLSLPAFSSRDEAMNALLAKMPDATNAEAMAVALVKRVIDEGDPRAFTTVRDTSGETQAQGISVSGQEPIEITIKTVN